MTQGIVTTEGTVTEHGAVVDSLLATVGNTPLVRIDSLSPDPSVKLFAKLEGANPTGSVKDRIAAALVDDLEARGELGPGKTLLESSSGNTAIALALVARRRGYPLTVVMADNVSPERRTIVRAFGASIVDSPGSLGSNGAIAKARDMARKDSRYALARARDPRPVPRHRRVRGRARDERDAHGRGPLPATREAGREGHRGRAAARGLGAGTPLPRGRVRARDLRSEPARPEVPRLEP